MDAEETGEQSARIINNLQDISFTRIGLILLGTWLAIWLVRMILPFLAQRGPNQARLYILAAVPVIRLALLTTAILWVVPIVFNVTFQNFLVIAGAASVAIGFAFKDYVTSLIAGITAIFERPYRPGDWVEIADEYGEVQSVGMRTLKMVTADDNAVTVPHSTIWTDPISNANDGARTLMCVASFYVAPAHDAGQLRAAFRDVALTSPYLEYDKPVLVMLEETPYGTHYKIKAYPFDLRDQFAFVSDLTVRGREAIAHAGAEHAVAPAAAPTDPV